MQHTQGQGSWGVQNGQRSYGTVGYNSYSSSSNLLGTSLGPQPLDEYRAGDDPIYGPLSKARTKVERGYTADSEISPDLMDIITQPSEFSYERPYVDLPSPAAAFRPMKITRNIPLPDALHQELNYKHLTARMGLFEEIDRAWFAIDNRLFLWDYTDGRDFNRYDEQADTIVSVGLVKARKDVFVDDITHVLIICTASKVTLIGVSRPSSRELNLYATNLTADLPTAMLQISGTNHGRVFLRGENKDLYELDYTTDSSWLFGSGAKVRVTNKTATGMGYILPSVFGSGGKEGVENFALDPVANRLFTYHTKGEIEWIDVSGTDYITRGRYNRLLADFQAEYARLNSNSRPDSTVFKVISMAPVGIHESPRLGLVVFASNGWRAYFNLQYFGSTPILRRPPPVQNLKLEQSTFYSSGTVFAVQTDTSQPTPTSILHMITPHTGRLAAAKENGFQDPSAANMAEWHTSEQVASSIWTIAETPKTDPANLPSTLRKSNSLALAPLARQANVESRSFIILSTGGIFFAVQSRPLDMLSAGLETERDAAEVVGANFGRVQLAAMSITLGAKTSIKNQDLTSALSHIMHNAQAPQVINGANGKSILYSPRHDGLALTLARFLRPIWDSKVTLSTAATASAPSRQVLGCGESVLLDVQAKLEQLRQYTNDNPFPRMQAEGDIKLAWDQEESSVEALKKLLNQAIEAISFILLLNDYRISEIIARRCRCDGPLQSSLSNLLWRDLVCSINGKDIAKKLVTALIEQQIGQELGIDTLSEILQQRCGTFVQPGDVVLYKAEESMRRAEGSRDPSERSDSLGEAVRLLSRAGSAIFPRIGEITKRMRSLQYAPGAIELGLNCASNLDPQDRALDYVHDGRHPQDARKQFFEQRMECYACVIETLAMYDEALNQAINDVDAAEAKRDDAYSLAINSDDELFHFYLYDWQVATNRQEQLLEYATPFIEKYLQETSSDIEDRRDLLWKFYARSGEYLLAAKALHELAVRQSPMTLTDRVYYLAQSLTSAKSAASVGADDVEFISSVQERLEVAQVQQEVGRGIEGHPDMTRVEKDEVLAKLNTNLLGLDELYQNFARPFRLYEPILLILKTADTRVDDVCEAVWRQLLQNAAIGPTPHAAMGEKVVELFRRYFPSEAAPLEDIVIGVVYSEALLLGSSAEEGWITRAMLEGGVPMRECWEVVMISHDQAETDEEREFYAEEAGVLADLWVHERDSIHLAEVERFVSAYLLRTQAAQMDDRKRRTKEMMNRAKAVIGRW
ncbi:Non-repetitive/WGA-negative nucleoporin C-terminal-domain-containing protein [Kockovaella imperatae]|uniref:Non-repetitive/WGA-negative nucleoporin C-terminal-domain-containing protein n=1 Tax=Kockovaella imperatae TaxID=4999 RepID=A0A1Y1U8R6_9TREE|nr:Non-repetitive/WGA-negative nucleoporin C-terminal-domain-containing protein [Kockovaella imperatae]ORX34408.1 Non-repetitive/WGA-negative nucleoporin C-terminal-domain-containing protein [Kockovaella imperatae]